MTIIFCDCGGERSQLTIFDEVKEYLLSSGTDVIILSDLCGLVINQKSRLLTLFLPNQSYLLIGCYKRSMTCLIDLIQEDMTEKMNISFLNLLELKSIDEAKLLISPFLLNCESSAQSENISDSSTWPSWFPLIDYNRCSNCGQCADFCLFGVFEKIDQKVKVVNPKGCKNNCPACARICPSTAIIFPKCNNNLAIAGSENIDELEEHRRQSQDVKNYLGDDIYMALERRKQKKQSIIKEETMKKAFQEREKALKEKS